MTTKQLDADLAHFQRELRDIDDRRLFAIQERRNRTPEPTINFSRLLLDLSTGVVHGEDREALVENARLAGQAYDPHRPIIQFRDLVKGVGSAGGFVVGTEVADTTDILRPWSVTARAGIEIESGLVGDQAIPKVTAKSTPAW